MSAATDGAAVVLDPVRDPRWGRFVDRRPDAGPFHHPTWLRLIAGAYGWPVVACGLRDDAGELRAGLPLIEVRGRWTGRRLVALPFSDSCQPLGGEEHLDELTHALDRHRHAAGLDLVVHGDLHAGDVVARYHGHRLALDGGPEAVAARFAKPQVLRGVRRARREGLVAERRTDSGALAEFHRLHVITRRRQGVPPHPRWFVLGLAGMLVAGLGFVILVRDEADVVAAAVFLAHGETVVYKYGASDPAALSKRPNNLVFHEAIAAACEDGRRVLDFGRTDVGHDTLRAFKRSFGTDEYELVYTCLSDSVVSWPGGRLAHFGAPVIRRGPPVVGRIAGAALHRHMVR